MRRALLVVAIALLAGCGRGGGSSATPPQNNASGNGVGVTQSAPPASTPPPSTAPPATPTPTPTPVSVSGSVIDSASGAAIAGASVALAPPNVNATPVPIATTAADGTYAATTTASTGQTLLVITPPSNPVRATLHAYVTLAAGANALGTQKLSQLSPEEQGWIALMNQDRASNGAGPLSYDEYSLELARSRAQDMLSRGYCTHVDPNGVAPDTKYLSLGGVGGSYENITCVKQGTVTYQQAEQNMMAEGPGNGTYDHYDDIVDPKHVWIGVGIVAGAGANGYTNMFVQTFITFPW